MTHEFALSFRVPNVRVTGLTSTFGHTMTCGDEGGVAVNSIPCDHISVLPILGSRHGKFTLITSMEDDNVAFMTIAEES